MGNIIDYVITIVGYIISALFAWWAYLIYLVVVVLYYLFFADSGGSGPNAQPQAGTITHITASGSIPVVFGTMWIRQSNCVWYGDAGTIPWEQCS